MTQFQKRIGTLETAKRPGEKHCGSAHFQQRCGVLPGAVDGSVSNAWDHMSPFSNRRNDFMNGL
jgi:hypothetical protein